MSQRTWIILGATSIIAKEFAFLAAALGHNLLLVGRDKSHLEVKACDIRLRFKTHCEVLLFEDVSEVLQSGSQEFDLFIGQSDFTENAQLSSISINHLVDVNIRTTVLAIHHYLQRSQKQYHLLFLSSVAALRGRAKNSLYGGTKAAIEVFLEGLQQQANSSQHITIASLGYIDTQQTYGKPSIFPAAPPKNCAKACWKAVHLGRRKIYYPFYWRGVMAIFCHLPFFIFRKLKEF